MNFTSAVVKQVNELLSCGRLRNLTDPVYTKKWCVRARAKKKCARGLEFSRPDGRSSLLLLPSSKLANQQTSFERQEIERIEFIFTNPLHTNIVGVAADGKLFLYNVWWQLPAAISSHSRQQHK